MNLRTKKLKECLRQLNSQQQQSVLDFATFLLHQESSPAAESIKKQPRELARPTTESVVAAMKRLRKTYYMLDTDDLLNRASELMGQHILHGRQANLVVDELQLLFEQKYESYLSE